MENKEEPLRLHRQWRGKLETVPKMRIATREDLALAYTPGVAEPCRAIADDPDAAYAYTMKANTVAVVSDGSAVLGLGNIGPLAALPVMEGKCALFKAFGGVNAVPVCLDTQDVDEIVETVIRIAPAFGGINLEDISAPRCFEVERRLVEALDIPVIHDDQHGTAIAVPSGVINALRLVGKRKEECRVVVNGAGSAGIAIAKLLLSYGFRHLTLVDRCGIVSSRSEGINEAQRAMLAVTNLDDVEGGLADALVGADVLVGVSAPGIVSADMVRSMNDDAVIFAMANPEPEIYPDEAKAAGRAVKVGKYVMFSNGRTVIASGQRGFIKVVADRESGAVLGAQLMCQRATDLVSQFTAAVVNGLTAEQLLHVMRPHPTFDEGIGEALEDLLEKLTG